MSNFFVPGAVVENLIIYTILGGYFLVIENSGFDSK